MYKLMVALKSKTSVVFYLTPYPKRADAPVWGSSSPPLHEMLKIPPKAGERGTKGVRLSFTKVQRFGQKSKTFLVDTEFGLGKLIFL